MCRARLLNPIEQRDPLYVELSPYFLLLPRFSLGRREATAAKLGNMMDIVCVFCGRDLELLRLQARSIGLYFDRRGLGRVIYVWNDTAALPDCLQGELGTELDNIDHELVPAATLGVGRGAIETDGWTTQQALKLLAAQLATAEHYLVLDAKNHFLWPCSLRDFVARDGRAIALLEEIGGSESFQYCLRFFGIKIEAGATRGVLNVTPFLLQAALVRRMLTVLEQKQGVALAELFLAHQHNLTEFMAYQAFAVADGRGLAEMYQEAEAPIAETVWGAIVHVEEQFKRCMDHVKGGQTKVLGLHWIACCVLSANQSEALCEVWIDRGLTNSLAQGRRIIDSVKSSLREGDKAFLRKSLALR